MIFSPSLTMFVLKCCCTHWDETTSHPVSCVWTFLPFSCRAQMAPAQIRPKSTSLKSASQLYYLLKCLLSTFWSCHCVYLQKKKKKNPKKIFLTFFFIFYKSLVTQMQMSFWNTRSELMLVQIQYNMLLFIQRISWNKPKRNIFTLSLHLCELG